MTSLTTLLAIMKYTSRSKSAAVQDIDIDIADILGHKYRYRIDIGQGDIDPPLLHTNSNDTHTKNRRRKSVWYIHTYFLCHKLSIVECRQQWQATRKASALRAGRPLLHL